MGPTLSNTIVGFVMPNKEANIPYDFPVKAKTAMS